MLWHLKMKLGSDRNLSLSGSAVKLLLYTSAQFSQPEFSPLCINYCIYIVPHFASLTAHIQNPAADKSQVICCCGVMPVGCATKPGVETKSGLFSQRTENDAQAAQERCVRDMAERS